MNITILGTGYVGLVSGTCFSENGNDVYCVDIDETKIRNLSKGLVPFYEPGLEELIKRNTKNGRLKFTTNSAQAIQGSKIIFIAVGTPPAEDGSSDLKYVLQTAKTIAQAMNEHKYIVLKSTVPLGASQKISVIIRQHSSYPFDIISNPEFLKEGNAIEDFLKPERVVIGAESKEAIQIMKELYSPFVRSGNPILVMDNMSAELSKYACNSFLATKISFINEIANLCESVGANIEHVRHTMITDSRIGPKFLYPGTGYGGSCFAKDVQALMASSEQVQKKIKILEAVEEVNHKQKEILFNKLSAYFKGSLKEKTIAVWGLSFKPNTDDIREAPAVSVIKKLLDSKTKVKVYDPVALENTKHIFENQIDYYDNSYDCLKNADALLILTEWNEFRKPNFSKIKALLKQPVIFDGRNLFDPTIMKSNGFYYEGIGLR
ncbi:MAG: UDP-glucose/GDP-mannose dehydrogenase family protein [Deltaproteobacteria bacterium]|nr:UDP-glucose/GDP-mannose dehydrogenase family protein [Deltaproteobacteria bacterium]